LSDIHIEVANIAVGAGIVLFVREGAIDFLEGYTYDEPWPDNLELVSLSYVWPKPGDSNEIVLSEERDLVYVRKRMEE
jgi:hypothetical protein